MSNTILPIVSLWKRELVRFSRDRNRLYGSIGQPLVLVDQLIGLASPREPS